MPNASLALAEAAYRALARSAHGDIPGGSDRLMTRLNLAIEAARRSSAMAEPRPLHVRLDEAGFRKLVAGEAVTLEAPGGEEVRLILADIGWGRITSAVEQARDRYRACPWRKQGARDDG